MRSKRDPSSQKALLWMTAKCGWEARRRIVAALRADRVWVVTRRLGKAVAEPPHSKGSRCCDRRGVGLAARLD